MGTNEWYTQPKYIDAARQVMGSIELDPASSDVANKTVKAERFFTKEQNGLDQEWIARSVWLNPPYGRSVNQIARGQSTIKLFVDKCISSYQRGDVLQAILLVTTEVNAKWFYPLWQYTLCFPDHRVNFMVPELPKSGKYSQMFGTCFVYMGPHKQRFIDVFSKFGRIVEAIDLPTPKPMNAQLWEDEIA